MRAVITRVKEASVVVKNKVVGAIEGGLLVLLGSEEGDTKADVQYIVDKTIGLRIFEDDAGKMNLSIQDAGGSILVVSQFTLLGDARKGRRPSFIRAGSPSDAQSLYEQAVAAFEATGLSIQTGQFQAHMEVNSLNDGPVTILLDSRKLF